MFDPDLEKPAVFALDCSGRRNRSGSARVLRTGGRVIAIEAAPRAGVFGAVARSAAPKADAKALLHTLTVAGLKAVRVLSEADGVLYLEGTKGR